MTEAIAVALVSGLMTLLGVLVSNSRSRAVMEVKIDELARRVINGEFGNGEARKAALGDKYPAV